MLKFQLIIALIIASFLFSCGPSKLEQTVAEGKRKLEERREQDRIKAQIESEAAEKRYQQALAEIKHQKELEAELARQQAEYDYKLAVLDAENRKLEIENKLRETEITSNTELRKTEIESKKDIRITELTTQSEIKKAQIQAYERITTERIISQANMEEAKLLSRVGVEQTRMQALIGAVQMGLDSKTQSEKIEAIKQIKIAKTIASTQIAQTEGVARIEAEAAVAIVNRISQVKSQQELLKYAATVARFSQY